MLRLDGACSLTRFSAIVVGPFLFMKDGLLQGLFLPSPLSEHAVTFLIYHLLLPQKIIKGANAAHGSSSCIVRSDCIISNT
jgi:hypothetical protein